MEKALLNIKILSLKKWIIPILLLFASTKTLKAQQYIPLLDSAINEWRFTQNYYPVRGAHFPSLPGCNYIYSMEQELSTYGDTVFNGQNYKVMIASYSNVPMCLFGFIREDTASRKVYFKDINTAPEITLYDFGMPVGDSLNLDFYNNGTPGAGYFENGNYTLDSIRNVTFSFGATRAFYLSHKVNFDPFNPRLLIWYEGIGNPLYTVYPYSSNAVSVGWFSVCQQFSHDFATFLTCFDHANKVYYDTCGYALAHNNPCLYFDDSCNYYNVCSQIQEISAQAHFVISPNPANDKLQLNYIGNTDAAIFKLTFYDISGSRRIREVRVDVLAEKNRTISIDVGDIPSGIYLIEMLSHTEKQYQKLVVMH